VIEGLDEAAAMDDVCVFHAGTRRVEDHIVSCGGRVLGVTALGDDIAGAKRRAYEAVGTIHFQNAYYRHDIADKAIPCRGHRS
jgi:phosphoribosylamine--glycine ligase